MKGGKLIAVGVSCILVVAVVIGVVTTVNHHKTSPNDDGKGALSSSTKAVAAICSPTTYKEACVQSLGSVANNQSATPQDFVQAAIEFAIKEVKAALEKTGPILGKASDDSYQKMAVEDCQDLLQSAVAELQASFSMVGDSSMHTMSQRQAELKNWLSAVISYQQSCMDGVTRPDIKDAMTNGLLNASQLTDNVLAIVDSISDILTAFNIPVNLTALTSSSSAPKRRLLDVGADGFPEWLSAADRKLLGSKQKRGGRGRGRGHGRGGRRGPVAAPQAAPAVVVAKDGSGQYKTITEALAAYPKNLQGRYVIYVKEGIYDEYVTVEKNMVNVFMYGDGPRKTIVTGKRSNKSGYTTMRTASFNALGAGFIAKSMGFENTAGPEGHQAVALRVQSDNSAFFDCRMDGYQDTLYVQTHKQFYRNCVVTGTIDFIFGDSSTVIQNSLIIVRRPMDNQQNTVTAHGRTNPREPTGLVIQNCRFVPEEQLFADRFKIPSYLGRPWKEYSRTVIMESEIGDVIQPQGWLPWAGNFALDTLYYAEYANTGPGSNTDQRVKWKGYRVIGRNEALQFTAGPFLQGQQWIPATGETFFLGLKA